jgi:hypothetical protein
MHVTILINVREYRRVTMDNPEKLATQATQDEEKQKEKHIIEN